MKLASIVFAAFALSCGAALAAPPTPMPGMPSSLIPVKHPPYKAICTPGFSPDPASYDVTNLKASFVCSDHLNSDGCNTKAGFGVWQESNPGTFESGHASYPCFKYQSSTGRWAPDCGSMTGFTAGPYDATTHSYTCTSMPVTCSGGLVLDPNGYAFPYSGGYFRYKCVRAGSGG